ncbi:MAG: zinc-ribbon domain-containing protein [Acutalibacteraceae bacterium]
MSFCPKCGAQMEESQKFCPKCGYSLDGGEQAQTNAGA